jgi:hypothetical protein
MDKGLPLRREALEEMRVSVSAQQEGLEKQQAGGPHPRPAAKPRQEVFAHQWLDKEQQERAAEYRQGVEGHRQKLGFALRRASAAVREI